jgi:hypothetical protein
VDWSAAVWAGVIAGAVFLALNLFVTPTVIGGNGWVFIRLLASPILGQDILAPPASFDGAALAVGLVIHGVLSVAFTVLLAAIIHRWGLIVGLLGGAAFGVALYGVNIYTLTLIFPWFMTMKSGIFLLTHVIFGAAAGGLYEALEVEEFVPAGAGAAAAGSPGSERGSS